MAFARMRRDVQAAFVTRQRAPLLFFSRLTQTPRPLTGAHCEPFPLSAPYAMAYNARCLAEHCHAGGFPVGGGLYAVNGGCGRREGRHAGGVRPGVINHNVHPRTAGDYSLCRLNYPGKRFAWLPPLITVQTVATRCASSVMKSASGCNMSRPASSRIATSVHSSVVSTARRWSVSRYRHS